MHKVLVVGCGGSGAKTLAYMMDQLKTTLAERLPERYDSPKDVELPRAWQFVSVDVPTVAEATGLSEYEVGTWFGFVVPGKVPDPIVQRLGKFNREIGPGLVRAICTQLGIDPPANPR